MFKLVASQCGVKRRTPRSATITLRYRNNHPYFMYTQRNIFKILSNQPEIRLYLPFSDWFGIKRTSVWFKINRKMTNTIWFRVDLIRHSNWWNFYKDPGYTDQRGSRLLTAWGNSWNPSKHYGNSVPRVGKVGKCPGKKHWLITGEKRGKRS